MKSLITLALLFISMMAAAQFNVYHPFPDSAAYWNVHAQGCCAANCPGPVTNPVIQDFMYTYFISGDTLANGNVYSKLYRSGSIHAYCYFGGPVDEWNFSNNEFVGGIRQNINLKKVYFTDIFLTSECLLYDFSLNVGDTLFGNCGGWNNNCAQITDIDSILIGNNYRKRFNLNTNPPYSVIEGIGSTSGLLEPLCPFEYFGDLICFSQDGQMLFTTGAGVCNNYTPTEEVFAARKFFVHPNPFVYFATVELYEPIKQSRWVLYNSIGTKVKQGIITNQEFTIFREDLESGMYIMQIFNENYLYAPQKIIIE